MQALAGGQNLLHQKKELGFDAARLARPEGTAYDDCRLVVTRKILGD
jgi:hypothetical protein